MGTRLVTAVLLLVLAGCDQNTENSESESAKRPESTLFGLAARTPLAELDVKGVEQGYHVLNSVPLPHAKVESYYIKNSLDGLCEIIGVSEYHYWGPAVRELTEFRQFLVGRFGLPTEETNFPPSFGNEAQNHSTVSVVWQFPVGRPDMLESVVLSDQTTDEGEFFAPWLVIVRMKFEGGCESG